MAPVQQACLRQWSPQTPCIKPLMPSPDMLEALSFLELPEPALPISAPLESWLKTSSRRCRDRSPEDLPPLLAALTVSKRLRSTPQVPRSPRLRPAAPPIDLDLLAPLELPEVEAASHCEDELAPCRRQLFSKLPESLLLDSPALSPLLGAVVSLSYLQAQSRLRHPQTPRLGPSPPPIDLNILSPLELPEVDVFSEESESTGEHIAEEEVGTAGEEEVIFCFEGLCDYVLDDGEDADGSLPAGVLFPFLDGMTDGCCRSQSSSLKIPELEMSRASWGSSGRTSPRTGCSPSQLLSDVLLASSSCSTRCSTPGRHAGGDYNGRAFSPKAVAGPKYLSAGALEVGCAECPRL